MNAAHLFHASEEPDIEVFVPRPPPTPELGPGHDCVWAVDFAHLPNYVGPRDCSRAIVRRGPKTSESDAKRFLDGATCVVTFQADWFERFRSTALTLYAFERGPHWRLHDAGQGAYVTHRRIVPVTRHHIARPLETLAMLGANAQSVGDLWSVIDAIRVSTVRFSIIRSRNLAPR